MQAVTNPVLEVEKRRGLVQTFALAGTEAVADPSGALYLPDSQTLVVADLHFEKGSAFAVRGQLLPPYDTAATLARLTQVIARCKPRTVVALGDSFHDRTAGERMAASDHSALQALVAGRDWVWVAGNHDPQIPPAFGETVGCLEIARLRFRHEPSPGSQTGEVAGHLHPAARVVSPSGSVRRRCFVTDGSRCVLPAFGAYAGGLNFRHPAFAQLFGAAGITAYVLGGVRVYAIPETACAPD